MLGVAVGQLSVSRSEADRLSYTTVHSVQPPSPSPPTAAAHVSKPPPCSTRSRYCTATLLPVHCHCHPRAACCRYVTCLQHCHSLIAACCSRQSVAASVIMRAHRPCRDHQEQAAPTSAMPGKSTASMPPPPSAPSPPTAADDAAASSHISAIISAAHAGRDAASSVSSSHTVTTGKKPPPVPAEYLSLTLSSRTAQSSSLPPNLFSPSSSAHSTPLVSECSSPAGLLSPSTRSQSAVPPPIPPNLMPPSSATRPRSPSHSPPLHAASSPTLSPTAFSGSDAAFHLTAPSALTIPTASPSSAPSPSSRSPPSVSLASPGPPPPLPPRKPKTHSVQPSLSASDLAAAASRAQHPSLSSPASSARPPPPSLPSLRSRISVMNKTMPSSILTEALRSDDSSSRGRGDKDRTPNSGRPASSSDDNARESFVSRVAHSDAFSSLSFSPPAPSSSPGAEQREQRGEGGG